MKNLFQPYLIPKQDQLDSIFRALTYLLDKNIHEKFKTELVLRLKATAKIKKKTCILEKGDIATGIVYLLSGSALIYGDRWAEVIKAKAREGIVDNEEIGDGVKPLIKELKRNDARVEIIEIVKTYDFIFPVNLLNGEPSPVRIVLSEDAEFLYLDNEDYVELLELYVYTEKLTELWMDLRLKRILRYEAEQEGNEIVANMVWLDEKVPGFVRELTSLQIGQFLGYREAMIATYRSEALRIIDQRRNSED